MAFLALLAATILGCAAEAPDDIVLMDDDFPAGSCRGSGTAGCITTSASPSEGSTTAGAEDGCVSSEACTNGVCVAPVGQTVGAFTCRATCVERMDEASWCADSSACCDPEAICTPRGYCDAPSPGSTGAQPTTDASADTGSATGETTSA